jgi:hypothetical protein
MSATAPKGQRETTLAELWKRIPYVEQVEIDLAVDKGHKPEAVNRCMCSVKGLKIVNAKELVDYRHNELRKMI